MRKKRKTTDTTASQPYDTSFKALLDDQTIAMLSSFFDEEVLFAQEVKERTREAMNDFESLLDSGHFVRQRVAKSRAEALAEGEAKGLQEALAITVELRFPAL